MCNYTNNSIFKMLILSPHVFIYEAIMVKRKMCVQCKHVKLVTDHLCLFQKGLPNDSSVVCLKGAPRSFDRSFFHSFIRSFVRSFVCLFVCSIVRLFVHALKSRIIY